MGGRERVLGRPQWGRRQAARSTLPSQTGGGTEAGEGVPRRSPAGRPAPRLPGSPVCLLSTWGRAGVAVSLVGQRVFLSRMPPPPCFLLNVAQGHFLKETSPPGEVGPVLSFCAPLLGSTGHRWHTTLIPVTPSLSWSKSWEGEACRE